MVAVIQFIFAARPWILCGIAVAVICAGMSRKKSKEEEKALEKRMALGTSLGLLFGVALDEVPILQYDDRPFQLIAWCHYTRFTWSLDLQLCSKSRELIQDEHTCRRIGQ